MLESEREVREGARKNEKGRTEGVCSLVQVGLKRVFGVQLKHATFVRSFKRI